jgi:hypothetical protein
MKNETFTKIKRTCEKNDSGLEIKGQSPGSFISCFPNIFLFILLLSFVWSPARAQNDTIQVDFGAVASPTNWNYYNGHGIGFEKTAMINSKGVATTVSMKNIRAFVNVNAAGTSTPDPLTGFPGTVTADNFYASRTTLPELLISGLDAAKDYTFIIFASRMGTDSDNREGEFKFIGLTEDACYLNATNNTANTATTTVKPAADGTIVFKPHTGPNNTNGAGNYHLNAMKIVAFSLANCTVSFTDGALTVCQDAANETYTAIAENSTSLAYSVLPAEAGVIDPATGVIDWNADFTGSATITATAEGPCGTTTGERIVTVNPATGPTTFSGGALTLNQDSPNETYTATAANSTSIAYSVLPVEAGVIDAATGIMDWDAGFLGTATITATSTGLCGITAADRIVTVQALAENQTIQVDFGAVASPANWNYYNGHTIGFDKPDMINSKGEATTVGMKVIRAFVNVNAAGTSTPDPSTDFPGTVTADNFYASRTTLPEMAIRGLNPDKNYSFIIFASRMGTDNDNREAEYKFIGLTEGACYLNATNNTSNIATTTVKPAADGTIIFKPHTGPNNTNGAGNYHLNAMKIVEVNPNICAIAFTQGASTVCQDAANEIYLASTDNSTSIAYSVAPTAAGTIDPATGEMNWDASFTGTATITASSTGACGTISALRVVTVNPAIGPTTFDTGAVTLCQDSANETYTATAINSTAVVYTVLPITAGLIDPVTGVMNWNADFSGTATITATSEGLCASTSADRIVTVNPATGPTTFTSGAVTVLQDAANETYTATAANSASIAYSVLPATAGIIDPVTGIMNWDAAFFGTATITATATGICGVTTADRDVIVQSTVGVEMDSKPNPFVIFPNPATDKLNVQVLQSSELRVMDLSGRVLIRRAVEAGSNIVNLNLESGLYLIQVTGADKSVFTTKINVE